MRYKNILLTHLCLGFSKSQSCSEKGCTGALILEWLRIMETRKSNSWLMEKERALLWSFTSSCVKVVLVISILQPKSYHYTNWKQHALQARELHGIVTIFVYVWIYMAFIGKKSLIEYKFLGRRLGYPCLLQLCLVCLLVGSNESSSSILLLLEKSIYWACDLSGRESMLRCCLFYSVTVIVDPQYTNIVLE